MAMNSLDAVSIILGISLIFVMFGMGTTIFLDDFKRLFTMPKAVLLGLINQVVFLPLIALILVSCINLPTEILVGIVVIAACPGGPLSNMISFLTKGDVALSVTLTAVSTCIALVSLPFWINIALTTMGGESKDLSLPFWPTVFQIALTTLVPIFLGMWFSAKRPIMAKKVAKIVRIVSMIFLLVAIIWFNVQNPDILLDNLDSLVVIGFVLNGTTMLVGYITAFMAKLPITQQRTISVETGIQNVPLALSITTIQLNSLEMALMPTLYGFCMMVSGSLLILAIRFLFRR